MSEKCSGENNGFYNKTHTPESRKKMSEAIRKNPPPGFKGMNHSEETKEKLRKRWGGKNPIYGTAYYSKIHRWARKQLQGIHTCSNCNKVEYINAKLHCANIDGKYSMDIAQWTKLCVPCHHKLDMKGISNV